jgi:LmbE family N-acetylglucosaminyl deacetylase
MKGYNKTLLCLFIALIAVSCSTSHLCLNKNPLKKLQVPSGKVLVVLAHQDDELFILSRLKLHSDLTDSIYIVWTASSHQKSKKYAEKRIQESLKGTRKLGVPRENCRFFLYKDGKTHLSMHKIITKLKQIISKCSPSCIYVNAYEGGHIDHDVANYSTVKALDELNYKCKVYEFPIYSGYKLRPFLPFRMRSFPPNLGTKCRRLSEEEYKFVLDYWEIFKSQHFPFGLYVSIFFGKRKTYGIEYLRSLPHYDYLKPPPGYNSVAYKNFLWPLSYSDFKNAVLKNKDMTH